MDDKLILTEEFIDSIKDSTLLYTPHDWSSNLKDLLDINFPLVFRDLRESHSLACTKDITVHPYREYDVWVEALCKARSRADRWFIDVFTMDLYGISFLNLYSNKTSMLSILRRLNERLAEYDDIIRHCRESLYTVVDFRISLYNALKSYQEVKNNGRTD